MPDESTESQPTGLLGLRPPKPLNMACANMSNEWKVWLQQFNWYSTAIQLSKKEGAVQVAAFMNAIGPDAVPIYNTFGLTDAQATNLKTVKDKFTEHFVPKPNESYIRYKFFSLTQKSGENFDDFLTKAKTLIKDCEFASLQDSLLRDKIVFGIYSDKIREKLLAEDQLTLKHAISICQASEQASKHLNEMKEDRNCLQTVAAVNKKETASKTTGSKQLAKESDQRSCRRCGEKHGRANCPAYRKQCEKCKRQGHFSKMCRTKSTTESKSAKVQEAIVDYNSGEDDDFDDTLYVNGVHTEDDDDDWYENIKVQNKTLVKMKLDSGAQCNVISLDLANSLNVKLEPSQIKRLMSFTKEQTPVIGKVSLSCQAGEIKVSLDFIVIEKSVKPILGKNSCVKLGLIKRVHEVQEMADIPEEIFKGLGCIKNFMYDIELEENADLKFCPPRKIPHAIKEDVKKEFDKMEQLGVVVKVTGPTPAVHPLVIVKKRGKLRPCIDPTILNKYVKRHHHPMKTLSDITAKVHGATKFTMLDAMKGFWQVKVTERTSKYLTVNTPWGRYSFKRVPFGLASAPEIYQQIMSQMLEGLPGVECAMDDILIFGKDSQELKVRTDEVIKILLNNGVRLNKEKCVFNVDELKFLGHILSKDGIKPDPMMVDAIGKLKTPTNVGELRRLLGVVNYLAKFIPNYSAITDPLRKLLLKNVEWEWSYEQDLSMAKIREALKSAPVLAFYDVNKDVTLSVDASSTAVGAVLLQDGQPIAYATKALTSAQRQYPQIEKEAFAIRFGCKKFHEYIYGKKLLIETDHKPLESIARKPLMNAPPRLQRIFFDLMVYSPVIKYVKGTDIPIADALSRDCTSDPADIQEEEDTLEIQVVLPMSGNALDELYDATLNDPELQNLKTTILKGWPDNISELPDPMKCYWNFRDELTVYDEILFKNDRPIIPKKLHKKYLAIIHLGHQGINSNIRRARDSVFWQNMNKDITNYVEICPVCQSTQRNSPREPTMSKPVPLTPWERVASDLFEFEGKDYLVIADSYSGFYDVTEMKSTTSRAVIDVLRHQFGLHGVPQVLESDNGPQYKSQDFIDFQNAWGFDHTTSSPYFPRSNGLAERYVQEAKNLVRRCKADKTDIQQALLNIRNTPREHQLGSPNQRLFSRKTRSLLPEKAEQLLPKVIEDGHSKLVEQRKSQKYYADQHAHSREPFEPGDKVCLRVGPRKWKGGHILCPTNAPRSYMVELNDDGGTFRRNSSQIAKTRANVVPKSELVVVPTTDAQNVQFVPPNNVIVPYPQRAVVRRQRIVPPAEIPNVQPPADGHYRSRYGRLVKPRDILDL